MGKTQHIHMRITKAEKKLLEAAAKRENRALSNYLITAGIERGQKVASKKAA